jgi:hypothetical protein
MLRWMESWGMQDVKQQDLLRTGSLGHCLLFRILCCWWFLAAIHMYHLVRECDLDVAIGAALGCVM